MCVSCLLSKGSKIHLADLHPRLTVLVIRLILVVDIKRPPYNFSRENSAEDSTNTSDLVVACSLPQSDNDSRLSPGAYKYQFETNKARHSQSPLVMRGPTESSGLANSVWRIALMQVTKRSRRSVRSVVRILFCAGADRLRLLLLLRRRCHS